MTSEGHHPNAPAPASGEALAHDRQIGLEGPAVVVIRMEYRRSIWEITRDGDFHGHYCKRQPAFDAARTEANAVVARGGLATIVMADEPGRPGHPNPA